MTGNYALQTNSAIAQEVRITKIDGAGNPEWNKSITTPNRESCYQIAAAYADGQTVVGLLQGKRMGNNGQYDIVETLTAFNGVERARNIVALSPKTPKPQNPKTPHIESALTDNR
jgi:hypothetical protein